MIGYVTLGTNDLERSVAFYDALFGSIAIGRLLEDPGTFVAWGPSMQAPSLATTRPFDNKPATAGNGVMVALIMDSRETVDAFHAKALELGAANEGDPGPRGGDNFYAGYFRDLDGNKLNAFCVG